MSPVLSAPRGEGALAGAPERSLRVLLVSFRFPPFNSVGAVRVGKTAKYLARFGHEVRVLTAGEQGISPTLPLELAPEQVTYTRWVDVNWPARLASGGRAKVEAQGFASQRSGGVVAWGARLYKNLLNNPDGQVGWYPFAVRAGERLLREWRPDVVFASALPITSLMVASRLAAAHGVPWVAEMRDLLDYTDAPRPGLPHRVRRSLTHRLLSSASALVTVSEPLAERLRREEGKPVRVVTNGFDAEDVAEGGDAPPAGEDGTLRIVYTGMIYPGRQDVGVLFGALRRLGPDARRVRVEFVGRYLDTVEPLARSLGVAEGVSVSPAVAYRESLALQRGADALLLVLPHDPSEHGVFTGKFFEYLAAGRPILAIGPAENVACAAVRDRGAGAVAQDEEGVAAILRRWLDEKASAGRLAAPPPAARRGFSRADQTRVLEELLVQVAKEGRA